MPAGTVLCLFPTTDIRELEHLAAVVEIFYADFAITDEHPGQAGCPPAFMHHIQRVASCSCRDSQLGGNRQQGEHEKTWGSSYAAIADNVPLL